MIFVSETEKKLILYFSPGETILGHSVLRSYIVTRARIGIKIVGRKPVAGDLFNNALKGGKVHFLPLLIL